MIRRLAPLVLAVLAAACAATAEPRPIPPEPNPEVLHEDAVPHWVGEPLSWDKLGEIEAWLATESFRSADFWRIEGELELAQGRVEFAARDREAGKIDAKGLRGRLALATQGFDRVATDPAASPDQVRRAQSGKKIALGRQEPAAKPTPKGIPMIARARWGAMTARPDRRTRATGRWTRITVHHSAEASGLVLDGTLADSSAAIRRIQKQHIEGESYGDIGYHYVIDPEGRVFEGRSLAWQGAHASGTNNVDNIGVCVLGNFVTQKPTQEALESLRKVLDHLRRTNDIPRSGVVAHGDIRNTECPGVELERWLATYR